MNVSQRHRPRPGPVLSQAARRVRTVLCLAARDLAFPGCGVTVWLGPASSFPKLTPARQADRHARTPRIPRRQGIAVTDRNQQRAIKVDQWHNQSGMVLAPCSHAINAITEAPTGPAAPVGPDTSPPPARPWPSVKQPTVRTNRRNWAHRPS